MTSKQTFVLISFPLISPEPADPLSEPILDVDQVIRSAERNIALAPATIRATGLGAATEQEPARINHRSLAKCAVLSAVGQVVPNGTQKHWRAQGSVGPLKKDGGVWHECTRNEWTLATAAMTLDIGVVGPYEWGFLREKASNRTFSLNVRGIEESDIDEVRGIMNGDKNGLFEYDPNDGNGQPLVPGSLEPEGPHGHQMEVTAANVAREDVLFPAESMAELDAACGASRLLRANMSACHSRGGSAENNR